MIFLQMMVDFLVIFHLTSPTLILPLWHQGLELFWWMAIELTMMVAEGINRKIPSYLKVTSMLSYRFHGCPAPNFKQKNERIDLLNPHAGNPTIGSVISCYSKILFWQVHVFQVSPSHHVSPHLAFSIHGFRSGWGCPVLVRVHRWCSSFRSEVL